MLPLIGTWRQVLFPGFLAIGLAILAIAVAMRLPAEAASEASDWRRVVAVVTVRLARILGVTWTRRGPLHLALSRGAGVLVPSGARPIRCARTSCHRSTCGLRRDVAGA